MVFDNFFVGSMPCMPARRELHTGRYNFLHRSWVLIKPFDDSMPEILKSNGVYSHIVTDHQHYWKMAVPHTIIDIALMSLFGVRKAIRGKGKSVTLKHQSIWADTQQGLVDTVRAEWLFRTGSQETVQEGRRLSSGPDI